MATSLSQALSEAKAKKEGCFDVMIDLEMFGPPPDGALATIGLVRFNRFTGEIGTKLHLACKLSTSVDRGMKLDPNTVVWWAMQHPDAGRALVRGQESIELQLATLKTHFTPHDTVWAKPVSIDLRILRHAYRLCSMDAPWTIHQEQCMSKLVKETKRKHGYVTQVERQGTHHNAEDDALTQALQVADIIANAKFP